MALMTDETNETVGSTGIQLTFTMCVCNDSDCLLFRPVCANSKIESVSLVEVGSCAPNTKQTVVWCAVGVYATNNQ